MSSLATRRSPANRIDLVAIGALSLSLISVTWGAMGAFMALFLLGEVLTPSQWFAIGLIICASIGTAVTSRGRELKLDQPEPLL